MKKCLAVGLLLFASLGLWAQRFSLTLPADVPASAAPLLEQRITQMLEAGGCEVSADATPLQVKWQVTDRMETPGSISQVALQVQLTLSAGEISETFSLKGVGENDADAALRAVKQLLPRSKAAQTFVMKIKQ